MTPRDGHIRVLPLHVANKIAAGEVVERPASIVKEFIENALDAGARNIKVTIAQGGRKLVAVQDDGCGMTREDALLSLERQATSKILDVDDIEEINTFGFRGEAIPSIASVSRFTMTTRRSESDEGFRLVVNAGSLDETGTAGCPPGTTVEARDLFCNVPARRKFLKSYATEEGHVKNVFTVAAIANPSVSFTLVIDGREVSRLSAAENTVDRVREIFGREFSESLTELDGSFPAKGISVKGFIEKPNLSTPTRRDQFVFINGRAATSPSVAYALREAYPRKQGDVRPAAIIFISLPPNQVDVNVHPMKREVRFRDNAAIKAALIDTIGNALTLKSENTPPPSLERVTAVEAPLIAKSEPVARESAPQIKQQVSSSIFTPPPRAPIAQIERAATQIEFAVDPESSRSKPWEWFNFLCTTSSGFILIETDAGIVTICPRAAKERIAYERLLAETSQEKQTSQALLIPETVKLPSADALRIKSSLAAIAATGFQIDEFGADTFKIDAVPQILGSVPPASLLLTLAKDLAEAGAGRGSSKWREEIIAKSVARSFAGMSNAMTDEEAVKLVENLAQCRMPYVSPRSKPTMIFTSTRELNRKFALD
ncbi:MAG: DNA mismatch repair endonuclease MutL [Kiritimatiellae bacterium]|nr:DNA mismatch repair endonuclease MutL [Kiritimatiellia bacterium]